MAASVQFRPQNRDLGMVMREVDEDLAIFLGMRTRNDRLVLVEDSVDFNDSIGDAEPKSDSLVVAEDSFSKLEIDNSDYDWLQAQRDISLLPPEEVKEQNSAANLTVVSNGEAISLKSELATFTTKDSANRRPSLSKDRKETPRTATPTRRQPFLPAKSKPSRALTSSKPINAAQSRSSTPSKATSSSSSSKSSASSSDRSSSGRKTGSTTMKNPVSSSGVSRTLKSRQSKPSEMLSTSHDAHYNPKISLPKRPASASRGRPSEMANHLSSSNGKPRQRSCSPNGTTTANKIGNLKLSRSRGYSNNGGGGDDVNPVLMGTKMVGRVVNMRKLAPPKQDEHVSVDNRRKSSLENSGFGRSLSKKSLDMAIRHMDIRRSIPVLSSSACGIQSSSSESSIISVTESPITSSGDSSKSSNCYNSYFLNGNQTDD